MRISVSVVLCLSVLSTPATARTPPFEQCMDARDIQSVRTINHRAILLSTSTAYAQVDVDGDCSDSLHSARILARDGWVCGSKEEYILTDVRRCAVVGLHPVDAKTFARLARAIDLAAPATLPIIETKGRRPRGFQGSFEYCVRPSKIVGWSTTPEGLRVVTRPRRHGGYKEYAVEFANACPESRRPQMSLVSNIGLDLVCGNAGDTARFYGDLTASLTGSGLATEVAGESGSLTISRFGDCKVSAVYPVR